MMEMSSTSRGWRSAADFGACGDGETVCTAALQRALDSAAEVGGGTIVVPPGKYLTGSLRMRSNVTLHLESGSVLVAAREVAAFPFITSRWEGSAEPSHAGLIAGEGLHNIAITGRGRIDGSGPFWWDLFRNNRLDHF